MPAKRSSNAKRGGSRAATDTPGIANDLLGIALAVIAIAMAASLLMPSNAPLTHAMAEGLRLGFGEGALLVPIALVLFAVTMFLPSDNVLVGRIALGIGLVVLSVLSMLSIMVPGAEATPDLVLEPGVVEASGGYVGAGVAWVLLSYTGQVVGAVVLVGLALAGIVVCGFSFSNLALRIKGGMGAAAGRIAAARERSSERRSQRRQAIEDEWVGEEPETTVMDEPATTLVAPEPANTNFIGTRKSSVIRRRSQAASGVDHETATMPLEGLGSAEPLATAGSKRHPRLKIKDERPAGGLPEGAVSEPQSKGGLASLFDRVAEVAGPKKKDAVVADEPDDEVPFDDSVPVAGPTTRRGNRAVTATPDAADAPGASAEPAVPEFLLAAAQASGSGKGPRSSAGGEKARSGRGSRAKLAPAPSVTTRPGDGSDDFTLPPLSLLTSNPNSASSASSDSELERTARRLQSTLEEFGLTSRVAGWTAGPLVTTFKIEMGEGERVNKITNLQDDIQLSLASESVRIFAPIPGTSLVGIEIPNKQRQNVCLGDVLPYAKGGPLEFAIGRDSEGAPVVADLARMPHMLVAGTTGSGKSVLINAIIMSLIMRTTPEQVRLILVDPKRVEFSCYAGLPHLYVPVVTEPRQAASALQWAVTEMDRRLKVFERAGARDVKVYNKMVEDGKFDDQENPPKPMPYLVIVIDELSDLMMVAGKDVEASIVRIAQLARAAGIHLVLATQRPSADVVTGLIKSNVDTRVALKVSSSIDSRVILDQTGAERLMGRGDMLFRKAGGVLRRVLGAYASDAEIESVVTFIRDQREPDYHDEILSAVVPGQPGAATSSDMAGDDDPLVWEAAQVVVDSQLGSTSGLQRRLKVGYARAGRIMDMLEQKGVVGPPDGSKPREVLLDSDGLEELRAADMAYREV